jgi:homoserine kinase
VRVPCSTSNLGAGFDCIGLALDRYLEASFEPADDASLTVEHSGTLAGLDVDPTDDALVVALTERLGWRGATASGLLRVHSEIPVGRGLGSSAAARVAGFTLAVAALGEELDRVEAWVHAASAEGHPDNAAPCTFGGLVAVVPTPSDTRRMGLIPLPLPLSPAIGWAYAAPGAEVSTKGARGVLPAQVERDVAVRSIRGMAALLHGLESAVPTLLAVGFADWLHVPYRLPLIPNGERALAAARDAGAWAATISGSGSGLIAAGPPESATAIADAMADAFRDGRPATPGDGVVAFAVSPDLVGAKILPP